MKGARYRRQMKREQPTWWKARWRNKHGASRELARELGKYLDRLFLYGGDSPGQPQGIFGAPTPDGTAEPQAGI